MKQTKRLLMYVAVCSALILLLSACTGKVTYKTGIPTDDIMGACASTLASYDFLTPVDEDYITYRMLLDTSDVSDYSVYIQNAGTSLDEIGIFTSATDDTTAVVTMVEDYIARRNAEWTGQYMVEEYPKLENAEYRVVGKYVVYGILSEDDKSTLFAEIESYLRAE